VQFNNAATEASHTPFYLKQPFNRKGHKHLLPAPQEEMDCGDTLSSIHASPTQKQLQVI